LAAAIRREIPGSVVTMTPGQRGDFKVTCDGQVRWDKKNREREFPDEAEFVKSLRS